MTKLVITVKLDEGALTPLSTGQDVEDILRPLSFYRYTSNDGINGSITAIGGSVVGTWKVIE